MERMRDIGIYMFRN